MHGEYTIMDCGIATMYCRNNSWAPVPLLGPGLKPGPNLLAADRVLRYPAIPHQSCHFQLLVCYSVLLKPCPTSWTDHVFLTHLPHASRNSQFGASDFYRFAYAAVLVTDATLTIRVIKSFPYRTCKNLVLHHLDLTKLTVGELKEVVRNGLSPPPPSTLALLLAEPLGGCKMSKPSPAGRLTRMCPSVIASQPSS
jgi:Uncharacterized conserved protein (DUF2340)